MQGLILSPLRATIDEPVEIVERKGLGHPDTICDALAEDFSRNLSLEYRRRFGRILHHNVDKVLLCGGRSAPAFKGGAILSPINIYLAGRVTATAGGVDLPIDDIAVEGARAWLRLNLHALNAARDVRIHCVAQPGSQDLRDLFGRDRTPLANDTSYGVAHAPLSKLESLVLMLEKRLNERDRVNDHPAWGEDIKIMGVRRGLAVELTIGCAMIGGYLSGVAEYLAEKAAVAEIALGLAHEHGFSPAVVQVNMADNTSNGSVFLTVGGTSAEAGDDGEVGRGNRANGLITPGRAMSLEAVAGKNPVSHVGKVYNVIAQRIVESLVSAQPDIAGAECLLVSRIGMPVSEPALVQVKIAAREGASSSEQLRDRVADVVSGYLSRTAELVEEFVRGGISQF
jgi:S-adenosylmethionine synthetase